MIKCSKFNCENDATHVVVAFRMEADHPGSHFRCVECAKSDVKMLTVLVGARAFSAKIPAKLLS